MGSSRSGPAVRLTGAVVMIGLLMGACGGSASPSAVQSLNGPTAGPSGSAKPSGTPSPSESSGGPIDFDVNGSIGGHQVQGKIANGAFTIPCVGAGPDQILTVHWSGEAPVNTALQGEIDLKPGTWTLGGSSAQGSATVNLAGGKATDSQVASSGTVTTAPTGGTIDAQFTGGSDSLHIAGTWSCPPA
jgi:hypothetical protein